MLVQGFCTYWQWQASILTEPQRGRGPEVHSPWRTDLRYYVFVPRGSRVSSPDASAELLYDLSDSTQRIPEVVRGRMIIGQVF